MVRFAPEHGARRPLDTNSGPEEDVALGPRIKAYLWVNRANKDKARQAVRRLRKSYFSLLYEGDGRAMSFY
jgi:hypothetical protein